MNHENNTSLDTYNEFCKTQVEGNILYNIDKTNNWGEYLLIVNIATVRVGEIKTYSMLLIGLQKEGKEFKPKNLRIKLTPDYCSNIPFLKYVGHCNFKLVPTLEDVDVNIGLAAVYGTTDLWKYKEKLSIRKPKTRKYDKEGKLVIKKTGNG